METIVIISDSLIFCLIIILPILLLAFLKKKKAKGVIVKYLILGFLLMALLIILSAAWSDTSNLMLLRYYGYDIENMNYENVPLENIECVKNLVTSIMGIGWTLKAIFGIIMSIPYLIFVYLGQILFDKLRNNKGWN